MWKITYTVLVVAVMHISATSNTNICSELQNNTLVWNTQDCSSYYECVDGDPIPQNCSIGLLFNSRTRQCDPAELVKCFQCPPNKSFADVAAKNDCHQFVRCFKNESELLTCAPGLAFDPELGMCNLISRVSCPMDCESDSIEAIFTRDSNNCAKYTVCVNGAEEQKECPESLVFNLEARQCDLPQNTNCDQANNEPKLICPREGGPLYGHPTNCSEAYACTKDNKPIVYPCREGLFFDYIQQYCAPRGFVACLEGSN